MTKLSFWPAVVLVLAVIGCASATGVNGSVLVEGGPQPYATSAPHGVPVQIVVTASHQLVTTVNTTSGTNVTIPLAPGKYELRAVYGNAGCESAEADVVQGQLTPFALICNIR